MFLWRNKKNYPRIITNYSSWTSPLSSHRLEEDDDDDDDDDDFMFYHTSFSTLFKSYWDHGSMIKRAFMLWRALSKREEINFRHS